MYTTLYHSHKIAIWLFLLLFIIKLVLLLTNSSRLEGFSKRFRVAEMIIDSIFLLTGIALLFQSAQIRPLFIIKITAVVVSIPLAFIGFKRKNKMLAVIAFFLLVGAYGMAEVNRVVIVKRSKINTEVLTNASDPAYNMEIHGKALFEVQCFLCHGIDGKQRLSGAKDLTITEMTEKEIEAIMRKGKNTMPAWDDSFTDHEIRAIANYVLTLKE